MLISFDELLKPSCQTVCASVFVYTGGLVNRGQLGLKASLLLSGLISNLNLICLLFANFANQMKKMYSYFCLRLEMIKIKFILGCNVR